LTQDARLRSSADFRLVYACGKRYDAPLMTVFVRRNTINQHRLGITASRRIARRSVDRNRLKRLLRESIRLNRDELSDLRATYDWVLNAKRSLLPLKAAAALQEFRGIIIRVKRDEFGGRAPSEQ